MREKRYNVEKYKYKRRLKKKFIFVFIPIFLALISVGGILSYLIDKDTKNNEITVKADYTVKYNSNNGTGMMEDQEVSYNIVTKLSKNEFTKTNHVFKEWNTSIDGMGTSYKDEDEIKNIGDITLYAQWELIDIIPPSNVSFTIDEVTDTSIKVTTTANDETGIKYFDFSLDGGSSYSVDKRQTIDNPVSGTTTMTFIYTGLRAGTTYALKVKALDKEGNYLESETQDCKTKAITADMVEFIPANSNWKASDNTNINNVKQALDYIYEKYGIGG